MLILLFSAKPDKLKNPINVKLKLSCFGLTRNSSHHQPSLGPMMNWLATDPLLVEVKVNCFSRSSASQDSVERPNLLQK